jgi:hypothetical protein
MPIENIVIALYLLLGVFFGFGSFSHRHLFSEGPDKASNVKENSALEGRIFWIMICTWLWPIMVFTGINSALILAKRKK